MDQLSPDSTVATSSDAAAGLVQGNSVFSICALTGEVKQDVADDKFDPVPGSCLLPLPDSRELSMLPVLVPVVSGGLVLSVANSINVSQVSLPNGVDLQTAQLLGSTNSVDGTTVVDSHLFEAVQAHDDTSPNSSQHVGDLVVDGTDLGLSNIAEKSAEIGLVSLTEKDHMRQVSTNDVLPLAQNVTLQSDVSNKKRKGGWPKGKKRKKEKDAGIPKAPATAYVLYAIERRQQLKDTHIGLPFAEATKILGNEWSAMTAEQKQKYVEQANAEKKRYIEQLKEYQQSEAYQNFLRKKKMKGMLGDEDSSNLDSHYGDYSVFLNELEEEGLYCKICNQYFSSIHNRKEHMFGKLHLQNVTSEFQKEVEREESGEAAETLSTTDLPSDLLTSDSDQGQGQSSHPFRTNPGGPLSIDGFLQQFMEANSEREAEINELRKSVEHARAQNIELVTKIQELKEVENKLVSDLANIKAYSIALATQIDGLRMVPTLFGMINF